jgi:hypothetical protein
LETKPLDMKKILIIFFISTFFGGNAFSQYSDTTGTVVSKQEPSTTQEIYNYITKGYMTTLRQGLDFKKGYYSENLFEGRKFGVTFNKSVYKFSFKLFYKEGEPSTSLATMALLKKDGYVEKIFCIPSGKAKKEIWDQFWKDTEDRLTGDQRAFLYKEIAWMYTVVLSSYEEQLLKSKSRKK